MKLQVLGTDAFQCAALFDQAQKALSLAGITADLDRVENTDEMMRLGVERSPALVINGEVKCSGRVAPAKEIAEWISEALM